MSFNSVFDGYCVIHAPFVSPERKVSFEEQLRHIGVKNYVIVEAKKIDDTDDRLKTFSSPRSRAVLSLIDAHRKCIQIAQANAWKSIAIFEDDFIFRDNFICFWAEVEEQVLKFEWEVMFLYRWQSKHLKESSGKVTLLPIDYTICTHCYVVREPAFNFFEEAMSLAAANGKAADDEIVSSSLKSHNCRIVATSRNLVGQGIFKSAITGTDTRQGFLEDTFRIQNPNLIGRMHWMLSKSISRMSRFVKH